MKNPFKQHIPGTEMQYEEWLIEQQFKAKWWETALCIFGLGAFIASIVYMV